MDIKGAGSDGKKFHEQSQSPLSIQSTLSQGAAQRPLIQPTKTYIRSKLLTVLPQFVNRRPPPRFAATGRLEVSDGLKGSYLFNPHQRAMLARPNVTTSSFKPLQLLHPQYQISSHPSPCSKAPAVPVIAFPAPMIALQPHQS